MTTPITAGDREPDLVFTLSDKRDEVDFSAVVASKVKIEMWLGEVRLHNTIATSVQASTNGKKLVVTRAWAAGETNTPGHWRIVPIIEWATDKMQTFPNMILEVKEKYDGNPR